MGLGIATKGTSDTVEIFYFFRKISEEYMTNANSCSLKELENQRTGRRTVSPCCHSSGGCARWQEMPRAWQLRESGVYKEQEAIVAT